MCAKRNRERERERESGERRVKLTKLLVMCPHDQLLLMSVTLPTGEECFNVAHESSDKSNQINLRCGLLLLLVNQMHETIEGGESLASHKLSAITVNC